jgi:hypothetical protein
MHLKLGMQCIDCHIGADIRDDAGIPSRPKKHALLCQTVTSAVPAAFGEKINKQGTNSCP